VGAAVAWGLISLRAETRAVTYLDDSSVHEQMVRFATQLLRAGHLPLTSWFPFLGEGSPQFLHYQSLPAMLTGAAGLVIGPDAAFRWSMYLLLALWPISVYLGARLIGAGRGAAGAAAAMSPFLASATGIGYEQHAYLWVGFGVWTQLWASWTLPLAWGFSWRAIRDGRGYFPAMALVALTVALHFETGYLALAPLLLWPFVASGPFVARARRACVLLAGALVACSWVIVPLLDQRPWAGVNESLQGTGLVNGYGAGRVVGWLVSGGLLDHGRLPVVTLFAGVGLVVALARWRAELDGRAVVVALGVCLLLSFGRATFGSLVDVIPGAGDIFFRRFMMGIQLAALLLAGGGAAWCWGILARGASRRGLRFPPRVAPTAAFVALLVVLAPAWLQLGSLDRRNAHAIAVQRASDATEGADVDRLISVMRANGGGRAYAGRPSNWGAEFTVGDVPVFKYLESRDVDEVGYTLRTASLMTGPEAQFDESQPSDYRLFGIRYLLLPIGSSPPVTARLVANSGPYELWTVPDGGYVHVGRIVGRVAADRTDLGAQSVPLLRSGLAAAGRYLEVAFGRGPGVAPAAPAVARGPAARGAVVSELDDLSHGQVAATIRLPSAGVAVLSASFDDGWTASVNGVRRPVRMIAPALVGVHVGAGVHTVAFTYEGYGGYPWLLALSALALVACAGVDRVRRVRLRE
jgi:hypothetical protein